MEKRSALTAVAVFAGLLGLCFVFLYLILGAVDRSDVEPGWGSASGAGPRVAVVELTGVITDTRELIGQLRELRKDPSVKAIVVRIDSPGGSVAPSQELFHAVERARKDKKVVCSMGAVAASGGYYVAAACDKIYASAGTITGSIGVISEIPHVGELLKLARVDVDTIKSGPLKDIGSPLRPMTAEERAFFQKFVSGVYEQFLGDVATARKLDKEKLRPIADGRILTGEEAKRLGLVDELGNLEDAIEGAARLAGATGDPVPLFKRKRDGSWIGELLRGAVDDARPRAKIEVRDPRL
jgi:protease IV